MNVKNINKYYFSSQDTTSMGTFIFLVLALQVKIYKVWKLIQRSKNFISQQTMYQL